MGSQKAGVSESEDFNVVKFEKQLTSLKDSQDCINTCCQWCLQNRTHHKKIVNAWLNVLKRVKVEQRLILFYLANDVVQYSKRKNYEYVESWGTALQKATTMVRDDRVKHKILRIFKIWEQRGVYNEEFISDLCGLLNVVPSAPKGDEPHEFQPNYVINKIKNCANLEKDTDLKLKVLKEHNPKIQIDDGLIASLKGRANVDDVEKEIDVYVGHMEDYINALKLEIKNRITLITVLKQAETQLEADRKDVKVVANAYKMFGTRVKTFQKKLEERKATFGSPVPSPDINAPSPSPDSDIELPEGDANVTTFIKYELNMSYNPKAELEYRNTSYYNPAVQNTNTSDNFNSNGFSSFIGSDLSFNLKSLNNSVFGGVLDSGEKPISQLNTQRPPLPVEAPSVPVTDSTSSAYPYTMGHMPLLPPPMPPFNKQDSNYNSGINYNPTYSTTSVDSQYENTYTSSASYMGAASTDNSNQSFNESAYNVGQYPPQNEEYNPEEDVSTWEPDPSWNPAPDIDTPESPPMFEKKSYGKPVEYHDNLIQTGSVDVDHRILPGIIDLGEDSMCSIGGKDVDHRNLISLTGSPGNSNPDQLSLDNEVWPQNDKDYRNTGLSSLPEDQDYRLSGFNIEQLKLPPPPPPPPKASGDSPRQNKYLSQMSETTRKSPKRSDNVESIDMDLSDDETADTRPEANDNLKVIVGLAPQPQKKQLLEPPPPLPDLPLDDVDANNFLDELSHDLHEFSNLSDDLNSSWNMPPPGPGNYHDNPPPMMINPPPAPLAMPFHQEDPFFNDNLNNNGWMNQNPGFPPQQREEFNVGFRGRGGPRGNFNNNFGKNPNDGGKRGWGRGGGNFNGRGKRGMPRGNARGFRQRGGFRGNFRGGF